jgi:hypothetical protein
LAAQYQRRFAPGPAKNQTTTPITGKTNTARIQMIFGPGAALHYLDDSVDINNQYE